LSLLQIGEVFGNDIAIPLDAGKRKAPFCPFRGTACTKKGRVSPLGICSFSDGSTATVTCPVRFLEQNRPLIDAASLAFGKGRDFIAVPEIRLLEVPGIPRNRKIGKVDFLLAQVEGRTATDFAALEIQSVYISGRSIRPAFNQYLAKGVLTQDALRRPDFRSSAQKRLMPQLALKVPIFRRWGKRFFVAVDSTLFDTLPQMRTQTAGNSEVTWLVYRFGRQTTGGYQMEDLVVRHTLWDDVLEALREGRPPEKEELLDELSKQVGKRRVLRT
jgi:hypothetical protein